jgi:hypothetical protein
MTNFEVINIKTGESRGIYQSERLAHARYAGPDYKIVKTKKAANRFPVGFSVI